MFCRRGVKTAQRRDFYGPVAVLLVLGFVGGIVAVGVGVVEDGLFALLSRKGVDHRLSRALLGREIEPVG